MLAGPAASKLCTFCFSDDQDNSMDDEHVSTSTTSQQKHKQCQPCQQTQPHQSHIANLCDSYDWKDDIWNLQLFPFCGTPGPTSEAEVNNLQNPYEYFKLFIDDNFIDFLVVKTNCYATQFMAAHGAYAKIKVL